MRRISIIMLFSCISLFSSERSALTHHRNPSYQSIASGSNIQQDDEPVFRRRSPVDSSISLKQLWELEHQDLKRQQEMKNRAALWASGSLNDDELREFDLKNSDYSELINIIEKNYPVRSLIKTGFSWALLGACCTIFVAGTENDITTLIQMPSVVNQAAYGGAYGGAGLALSSWSLAVRNKWRKYKKLRKLREILRSYEAV